jgi:hypothetical protein
MGGRGGMCKPRAFGVVLQGKHVGGMVWEMGWCCVLSGVTFLGDVERQGMRVACSIGGWKPTGWEGRLMCAESSICRQVNVSRCLCFAGGISSDIRVCGFDWDAVSRK